MRMLISICGSDGWLSILYLDLLVTPQHLYGALEHDDQASGVDRGVPHPALLRQYRRGMSVT